MLLFSLASAFASTLAVLPFEAHTDDPELVPLGAGIADMLTTDLARAPGLQLVERSRLDDVLQELQLSESAFLDPATAKRFGHGIGADAIVVGGLSFLENTVRIDARVIDVETGQPLTVAAVEGPTGTLFSLERRLSRTIAAGLQVTLPAEGMDSTTAPLLPLDPKSKKRCRKKVREIVNPVDGITNLNAQATLNRSWSMAFGYGADSYALGLAVLIPGALATTLEAGQELRLAREEGDMVLAARASVPPGVRAHAAGLVTLYQPQYLISASEMQALATSELTRVTLFIGGSWYSIDIPEGNRTAIRTAARCLVDASSPSPGG